MLGLRAHAVHPEGQDTARLRRVVTGWQEHPFLHFERRGASTCANCPGASRLFSKLWALLVIVHVTGRNVSGYQNGTLVLGTTHLVSGTLLQRFEICSGSKQQRQSTQLLCKLVLVQVHVYDNEGIYSHKVPIYCHPGCLLVLLQLF